MSLLERGFSQEENMNVERATSIVWCVRELGWDDGELAGVLDATDAFYGEEMDDDSALIKGIARIREKAVDVRLGSIVFDTVLNEKGAEGLNQIGVMERPDLLPMVIDVRRREYVMNLKSFIEKISADDYLDHFVSKYFNEFERWKDAYKKQLLPFLVTIFERIDPGEYAKFDSLSGRKDFLDRVINYINEVLLRKKLASQHMAVVVLLREFVAELLEGVTLDMKEFTMWEYVSENVFLREAKEDREDLEARGQEEEEEEEEDDDDNEWDIEELEGWKE